MQRKFLVSAGALGAVVVAALVLVLPTLAMPTPHHDPSARPNPFALEHPHGPAISHATANADAPIPTFSCGATATVHNRVVDVKLNVTNDADSGLAGDYWAFDTLTRTIEIYQLGGNTWCATVTDRGTFDAIAGQTSPGKGGTLTGDESGKIAGGYVSTVFTGDFTPSDSNWPTHGNVRPKPIDYQCDVNGNCPGYISWVDQYFSNVSGFDLADWGWTYTAQDKDDGVWVNAASGTYGDILDQD